MPSLKEFIPLPNNMIRIRINFDKTEAMRFTGHLDLYRTWERTLRRAGLPLAYSQGFKPHPRIQIAAALPLGFTSSNDLMDIWLNENIPLATLHSRLQAVLPSGLQVNSLTQVPPDQPSLQSLITASEYHITLLAHIPELESQIQNLMNQSTILIERRQKSLNLRPLLLSIELLPENANGYQCIHTLLQTNSTTHARPDELIRAMGIQPEKALFHRVRLHFAHDNIQTG